MKKFLQFHFVRLTIVYVLFFPFTSHAGHLLGTNITYEYVGPNQYLVQVRLYRDCQGLPAPMQVTACYNSTSAGVSNSFTLNSVPSGYYILPDFPYWPPMTNSCNGGPAIGIDHYLYQGLMTLPSAASDWIISYSSFPTNIGIGQNFLYVSTKIDNVNYPINSSNWFNVHPTFIYCVNQPAWDNFSSGDINGDSLSYHFIPIEDNSTACPHTPFINPVPAFPALQSMSSTPVIMDSTNGSLTFNPFTVGTTMVAVRVDEHRNGVLINNSTIQHVMYLVTGCTITGIDEVNTFTINLHPNPANNILHLDLEGEETPLYIDAIDISGKVCSLRFDHNTTSDLDLDISALSPGMYTLRVISENSTSVVRFIVTGNE